MTVNAGDIAFIGANSTDPDQFAFVTRNAIAGGDSFFVTDGGFIPTGGNDSGLGSTTFRPTEGFLRYTAPADGLPAGAVILVNTASGSLGAVRNGGGDAGTVEALANGAASPSSTAFALAAAGDQLTAYTVTGGTHLTGDPTLIAFMDFGSGAYTGSGSTSASNIPVIAGGQVLDLGNFDNTILTVSSEDPNALTLVQLNDALNFAQRETTRWDLTLLGVEGASITIDDVSVAEGDGGFTTMTFTVSRSNADAAFTLDFATTFNGTATAGADFLAASGTLTFAAGGALTQTIPVEILGDTETEPNEQFAVILSNLVVSAGSATLADNRGVGTITNDDVTLTEIWQVQGAGHSSPLAGQRVNVEGVVTAVAANGFYLQDPTPDAGAGSEATSDAIFVFTGTGAAILSTIAPGETLRVLDTLVSEFRPGNVANNLTITQLSGAASYVDLGGSTTVAPVVFGTDRSPPAGAIDDDGFASFDPATDAIDFFESLEGMLIELPASVAVSPTARFGTSEEIWVVVPGTGDGSPVTPDGAPLLRPTDANPERIQLDDLVNAAVNLPDVDIGAQLGGVTGVLSYDFQNYELLLPAAPTVLAPSSVAPEITTITRDARQLTVATYNVENLDPGDGAAKFARHAAQIVDNLGAPVIVALQEVQDNNGATNDAVVAADVTLQTLVDAIAAAGGPAYAFVNANPVDDQDGGEPGGNIRTAFLYRANLVTLLDANPDDLGSMVRRLLDTNLADGDAFQASRKPLLAQFDFNGQVVTLINNHFNSKGGDNALFGSVQPPVLSSEVQREQQAAIVRAEVAALQAADAQAKVVVLGDLNDFAWSDPNLVLTGAGPGQLFDLAEALLPETERYSYNFQGNAQSLDHTLVNDLLLNGAAPAFDIVHVNSSFADQASDHDPAVARLDFRAFGERLVLGDGDDVVNGEGGDDSLFGEGGFDRLFGGEGNDSLDGGLGPDRMLGGTGDDSYVVDDTLDRTIELAGEGFDTVFASVSLRLGAEIEAAILAGLGNVQLIGNALGNAIAGNAGDNRILAGLGDDTADGGAGLDRIFGEDGADSLVGGEGDDLLNGGEGADTVDGGTGRDRLAGGAGNDVFLFGGLPGEADVVLDFAGGDRIGVVAAGFDPLLETGTLDGARFESNATGWSSAPALGIFVFEADAGRLWFDGAGDGRDLVAILRGVGTLSAGDILVV
ncbi:Calx-beta domain-containing protein [Falsiroseomonas oryzae]|uniref:Calx-beta domain-containing protein n=1 Tax=Falsiroseomonas oryzae TaxID=2766473 RepID=UPI0022EB8A84|nr:endonuclease/exonuclease/phosphatase family protein [Roseomonas sp. MO-31]